jgi:nicotinate phosphoribosyltransferase
MARSFTPYHPGLLTDLYHPDSAYVAWRTGKLPQTTFDLYARSAPFGGTYLLVAGLEMALEFVRSFRYTDEDLAFLAQIRDYDPGFLNYLKGLHFSGEIMAVPEGSIAFPNEPLLRVTAPFPEALLLESGLLQAMNLATLIATKASRVTYAARGRPVAEFSLRRAQDPYVATRSSRIGGCFSTSFLGAAYRFRLPSTGTVPHALIQLFDTEREAFEAIAVTYNRYTLLLDTYDPRAAIHIASEVAGSARERLGHVLAAVRLDSGDLIGDARYVRDVLDRAGLDEVRIAASGDLDEFSIQEIVEARAPIDSFGVGTSLGVGAGSVQRDIEGAALGGVYKEVFCVDDRGGHPKFKIAGEKSTWPGVKEVYRLGAFDSDVIQLADEPKPRDSERLLRPVVLNGEVVAGSLPPLSEIWEFAQANLRRLPDEYRQIASPKPLYGALQSGHLRDARTGGGRAARTGRRDVMGATVLVERDDHLAHLVLNRPEVLNAIDNTLARELTDACIAIAAEESVWAVILRGAGDRAFCAGADLKARRDFTPAQWTEQRGLLRQLFRALRTVPQPMIAAVHGFALGGGTELAMLADFIVASDDAVFGLTEVSLGIIPGGGGTQNLPRLIGRNRAKELIFSARRISAAEALELGLVNRVVPRPSLLSTATSLAQEILKNSPFAVRQAKWAIDQGADLPFEDGLEREHEAYMRAIASDDRREGIAAFNEKRKPQFSGR